MRPGPRYVVTLSRTDTHGTDVVVIGPFRTRGRADERAGVILALANTYEDPEGVTGEDNALDVIVEPIASGRCSALRALDLLYGSIGDE